jgi:hypothetical protein
LVNKLAAIEITRQNLQNLLKTRLASHIRHQGFTMSDPNNPNNKAGTPAVENAISKDGDVGGGEKSKNLLGANRWTRRWIDNNSRSRYQGRRKAKRSSQSSNQGPMASTAPKLSGNFENGAEIPPTPSQVEAHNLSMAAYRSTLRSNTKDDVFPRHCHSPPLPKLKI